MLAGIEALRIGGFQRERHRARRRGSHRRAAPTLARRRRRRSDRDAFLEYLTLDAQDFRDVRLQHHIHQHLDLLHLHGEARHIGIVRGQPAFGVVGLEAVIEFRGHDHDLLLGGFVHLVDGGFQEGIEHDALHVLARLHLALPQIRQ